jgi:hypothetical protein
MKQTNMLFCLGETDIYGNPINLRVEGVNTKSTSITIEMFFRPKIPPGFDRESQASVEELKTRKKIAGDYVGRGAALYVVEN